MANVRFYLDARRVRLDGECPLKLAVSCCGRTRYLATGVSLAPAAWDARSQLVRPGFGMCRELNVFLSACLDAATRALRLGAPGLDAAVAAARVALREAGRCTGLGTEAPVSVAEAMRGYAQSKAREKTRQSLLYTLGRLEAYCRGFGRLSFEDVTPAWLSGFDAWLVARGNSANTRGIHFRNIRTVFNAAIDAEQTAAYPFRRFKIPREATRKRSLPVEDLRRLFDYPVEGWQREYLDYFRLTFMLVGINSVDLLGLRPGDVVGGRIEYRRSKTGRLYSIRVEPEAAEIIGRYRGVGHLLAAADRYADYEGYRRRVNMALQSIGECERHGRGGRKTVTPAFPGLTTYWARHSWATVAASLDIPRDTIAHALGHGGNTVTDIYIDFDQGKVDVANRRVLDWVLYGRR